MATAEKILMGTGVLTVGGTPLGLTRGGGTFTVEREYRPIEADGDKGKVKGRLVIDSETAKFTINGLELFTAANLLKYYPALSNTDGLITSTFVIAATDYNDVVWVGATKDGKACTITVKDALNLDPLEWAFEEKSEVVPQLAFEGTYAEGSSGALGTVVPHWSALFAQ